MSFERGVTRQTSLVSTNQILPMVRDTIHFVAESSVSFYSEKLAIPNKAPEDYLVNWHFKEYPFYYFSPRYPIA